MTELSRNEWVLQWDFLVADAWADEELMARLLTSPAGVLAERGFPVPEGAHFEVVREAEIARIRITCQDGDMATLVLPSEPENGELSESDLEAVVSGKGRAGGGGGGGGAGDGRINHGKHGRGGGVGGWKQPGLLERAAANAR